MYAQINFFSKLDEKMVMTNGIEAVNIPLNRKASLASTGINVTTNLLLKTNLSTLVVDCKRIFNVSKSNNNDCTKRRYDYCYL